MKKTLDSVLKELVEMFMDGLPSLIVIVIGTILLIILLNLI